MYEPQSCSRRYLNDMIYENGSLEGFGGPEEASRWGGRETFSLIVMHNYRIVLARALTYTRMAQLGAKERPRALR